jgi:hypothetical protein
MATPVLYTTVEAIRACLGTDLYDIEDQMILDADLGSLMLLRLSQILPSHETVFDTEQGELQLKLWCQAYGALMFIETGQLAIAQRYSANQDQLQRFDVDFEELMKALKRRLGHIESLLIPDIVAQRASVFTVSGRSVPDYDPVIGPG